LSTTRLHGLNISQEFSDYNNKILKIMNFPADCDSCVAIRLQNKYLFSAKTIGWNCDKYDSVVT